MNISISTPSARRDVALALLLAAAMWLTRSHDVTIALPDITWAAFFLAGAFSRRWPILIGLALNSFAIDFMALARGESDYCMTPAYAFLLPTYLSLWAAGRWSAAARLDTAAHALRYAAALVAGTVLAFCISNAGFYAFAGYFDAMSAFEYARRVLRYLPAFLTNTMLYGWLGLVTACAVQWLGSLRAQATRSNT